MARNIINPDDGIALGYFFGPGFNDGQLHNGNAQRMALGSHVLFREARSRLSDQRDVGISA